MGQWDHPRGTRQCLTSACHHLLWHLGEDVQLHLLHESGLSWCWVRC